MECAIEAVRVKLDEQGVVPVSAGQMDRVDRISVGIEMIDDLPHLQCEPTRGGVVAFQD